MKVRPYAAVLAMIVPILLSACATTIPGTAQRAVDAPGHRSGPGPRPTEDGSSTPAERLPQPATTTAEGAVFTSGNVAGELDPAATAEYLAAVIAHADTVWTNWFLANGLAEPWVSYHLIYPGETYTSRCTLAGQTTFASDFPNAFYCDLDFNSSDAGVLVLPVETFARMWTGNILNRQVEDADRVGDFAAAVIAAHEFGHHIQAELTEQWGITGPANPNSELIADCFAGVWAYSVYLDGYLEEGDLDEALNALAAIGDGTGSHGTSDERKNAFLIGYWGSEANPYGGVPTNCTTAFWPAATG